ncbi:MAG: wax ester/triacylglycerol synthase domain-containing protein [Candidatus Nanopelagicales bacterium]
MSTRTPLSPNDALWLNMDSPENLMVIETVMWVDQRLDADEVIRTLRRRMVDRYPVFTWRPEPHESLVSFDHWIEDPTFDIDNHISVHELPGAGGREEMQAFLESRMSEPLPRGRPLWHAHILQGRDFAAVMMRFHHAIADGTALVRVLLDVTTESPDEDPPGRLAQVRVHPADPPSDPEPTPTGRARRGLRDKTANALTQLATLPLAAGVAATNAAASLLQMLDPDRPDSLASRLAAMALGTADAVDKLVVGVPPDVLFYGRPGVVKRADWGPAHDLTEVKRIARAGGATVNDVMLAAVTGGLRRYQVSRGEVPRDVVTLIPVNLRPLDQPLPPHLGNKWALVAAGLPLSAPTARDRLRRTKAQMDLIKRGPEAMLTFGLSHAIGAVGAVTGLGSRAMVEFFCNKAIGVTTNVAGPTGPRYLAGQEVMGILGWVPGASRLSVGVCIFSYNGQVRVGFKADAGIIPDVANLVAAYAEEMADMLAELPA